MNLEEITSPSAKKFIQENTEAPVEELLLRAGKYTGLNIPLLVTQIEGKQKAKKKLPSWYHSPEVIYPVKLSMEQCSSETTAAYKTSLVSGDTLIDLTGGFGVDSMAFAGKMKNIFYIEQNQELCEIAAHNFKVFHKENVTVVNARTEDFITAPLSKADWIFLDPARRKSGSKVFRLADCEPDILALKTRLFEISNRILVKTSPLLDLDIALKELQQVSEIHVIAVENECKELLFLMEPGASETRIIAVNIRKDNTLETFRFTRNMEREAIVRFHLPQDYLYEPNAAILKAGAFRSIAAERNLFKLNASSHLYTSATYDENFPGRSFKILKTIKYSKKEILQELPEGKANITARNFPDSVELIRKKTGLKDGGSFYLFATKDLHDKPVILLTEKIH